MVDWTLKSNSMPVFVLLKEAFCYFLYTRCSKVFIGLMCAVLAGGWLLTKKSMGADTVDLCVLVSFINKEIKSFLFL